MSGKTHKVSLQAVTTHVCNALRTTHQIVESVIQRLIVQTAVEYSICITIALALVVVLRTTTHQTTSACNVTHHALSVKDLVKSA